MAEIHYFGVGHSGDKKRYNELKSEILAMENQALKSLTVSRTKLVGEMDGADVQIKQIIGDSPLSVREKKEVLSTWERTKKAVFNSRSNWNALLKEARKVGPNAGKPNGTH